MNPADVRRGASPLDRHVLPEPVRRQLLAAVQSGEVEAQAFARGVEAVADAFAALRGPGEGVWKRPLLAAAQATVDVLVDGSAEDTEMARETLEAELCRAARVGIEAVREAAQNEARRAEALRGESVHDALAGASAEVRALGALAPESEILASFRRRRAAYLGLARRAARSADPALVEGTPGAAAEALRQARGGFERARAYGAQLELGVRRRTLDEGFVDFAAPGSVIERLNSLYYRTRGAAIYEDFRTLAVSDPTLSAADAWRFRRDLSDLDEAGRLGVGPIHVVEIGVGDGSFAATFLAALEALERGDEPARRLLPRLRYHLCDLSPRMLAAAASNPALAPFAAHLERHELDAAAPGPLPVRPHLVRLQELLTDVPGVAVVYRGSDGHEHRAQGRAALLGDVALRLADGTPITAEALTRAWREDDRALLEALHADVLAAIGWEVRFQRSAAHPGAAGADDLLFPVSEGASRLLLRLARDLAPGGCIRAFDYAGWYGPARRHYGASAQVVRRYGGNATASLNLGFVRHVLEEAQLEVGLATQAEFVSEAHGEAILLVSSLAPQTGRGDHASLCSAWEAVLPLTSLASHEAIAECAASLAADGDEAGFVRFADRIRAMGFVHPGLPLAFVPEAANPLDNLALELDDALCAVFRGVAAQHLKHGLEWLSLPRVLADASQELVRLGFRADRLPGLAADPGSASLWTLEVRSVPTSDAAIG